MKRILAVILALSLMAFLLPAAAMADGFSSDTGNQRSSSGGIQTIKMTKIGPVYAGTWDVYSYPSYQGWRGAGGAAKVATSSTMYVGGWDGRWLLVAYTVNNGGWRVGYVNGRDVLDYINAREIGLSFQTSNNTTISGSVKVSDDPTFNNIAARATGTFDVIHLCNLSIAGRTYAYYQTEIDGMPFRGFIVNQ